ncbi:hypothetical protein GCM10009037_30780 [Halarchaeum grantii]|uniref:Uncharacterized protein n=1 Tax=Halarchaeum grantii TaxID=1193105 RepID=A0A830F195_9EURY|nr:hypothetical protein [Halarchaeum grantii]GGL45203.1 hypothetical protein GCM10009037_30780 [Halarchaeum grantii]
MTTQDLRWNIASLGLIVAGVVGAVLTSLQLGAYLASGLLLLVAIAGVLLLLQKQKAYSVVLLVSGILALIFAAVGYLNQGFTTLTILYVLLAIVGLIRGGQALSQVE